MHQIMRYSVFTHLLLSLSIVFGAFAQDSIPSHTVSIEGTLLMLDDKTPHVAVVVQAIRGGKLVATVLSDEGGKYQLINLKPGTYQVRCYTLDGYLYYSEDKPVDVSHAASLQVKSGRTLKNIDLRFAPFKKGSWKTYTRLDGLADNSVLSIHRAPDGVMWIGTDVGVSRYDGKEFINFTARDGLVEDHVWSIDSAPDGVLWFGTQGGVSRYDGKEFVNFTMGDELTGYRVWSIHRNPDGVMWFGTRDAGVFRYDGKEFVNFAVEEGLAHNNVYAIHRNPDGVMWFGTQGGGVSRYDGKEFVNFTMEDGLAGNYVDAIYCDSDGVMWFGTAGGVSRYDGREFISLTKENGLAGGYVSSIYRDPDGIMWFATWNSGVSRYDGQGFINFTTQDGLADSSVHAIYADPDGAMWFPTEWGGLSKYDRTAFSNLTTKDGLVNDFVQAAYHDPDSEMWFGTQGGVSRYDGKEFTSLTTEDGLAEDDVRSIYRDPDGVMWFGVWRTISRYDGAKFANFTAGDGLRGRRIFAIHRDQDGTMWFGGLGHGVYRYDGEEFININVEDGLADDGVRAIHRDPDGILWLATRRGISCYDEQKFVNITREDGLVDDFVRAIHRDPDGVWWFGTNGGVSRYDGQTFTNYTTDDGLAHNRVECVYRTSDSILCFGTGGAGVSMFDGDTWASLDTRDGLVGNNVSAIQEDADGSLVFATDGGVTLYRRNTNPPEVHVIAVNIEKERYTDLSSVPDIVLGNDVSIECSALDFKTLPEKRQYRYRIQAFRKNLSKKEIDSDWRKPIKSSQFEWTPEKSGDYIFEVQAIDRDLNYSQPASLALSVVLPYYLRAIFLIPTIGFGVIVLSTMVFLATALTKRRRQVHAYQESAVRELQDAREMQMSLLPEAAPLIEGMEIVGRTIPANTVGGDFFDYLALTDGKVGIALADVSGKGLRAAMNAVMTSGMLYEVVKTEISCGRILSELNAGLYPRMEKQTFAAFSFATLSQNPDIIQWANAAQPRPLIKRGSNVSEFQGEGGLPLGMIPGVTYPDCELKLQAGDIVVLYTDGVIEAEDEAEEMYGAERLEKSVISIDSTMGAEEVIEAILQDVSDFVRSAQQYDDMTVVVVKKL